MVLSWAIAAVLGVLIIAALAFYLGRLLGQIKHNEAQAALLLEKRNRKLADDIYTIAWAMRDGQCDFSEGCIRISVLLDHLTEQQASNNSTLYPGIFGLYEHIKDMPTHEARRQQPRDEKAAMDQQRAALESQFDLQIRTDIDSLIERFEPIRAKYNEQESVQTHSSNIRQN